MGWKIDSFAAKILDQERHAPEWAARQTCPDRGTRSVFLDQHYGIQRGVMRGNRIQRGIKQFVGRYIPPGNQCGHSRCVHSPNVTDHARLP